MNAIACAWHAAKPANMNKRCLLSLILLVCSLMTACSYYHVISYSRPELQWKDKPHCIVRDAATWPIDKTCWQWHPTPENTAALNKWWAATEDFGTMDFWPRATEGGIIFALHPRLYVVFNEINTKFCYNRPGYDWTRVYTRRATEADRTFCAHLQHIINSRQPMPAEAAAAYTERCIPPFPRTARTAYIP